MRMNEYDWSRAVKVDPASVARWVGEAAKHLKREIPADLKPDTYWMSDHYVCHSGDTYLVVVLVQTPGTRLHLDVMEATPRLSYDINLEDAL